MSELATGTMAIETRGLTKRFGSVEALAGLDLNVPPGSVFGFLGPNGAGKTTALSILAGLSHPTAGTARVCGRDAVNDGPAVREQIGFLRQDPRFYPWMTGRETLEFTGRFFNMADSQIAHRADELLALVDLKGAGDRKMGEYSGGMRQRLGVAQALVAEPAVLLLDEPCSSLDPAGRFEVVQIMDRLRGSTTVFYSTHILQDVERVADEVAIISHGTCIRQAPMRDLLAASKSELVIECEGDMTALAEDLGRQPFVLNVTIEPGTGDSLTTLVVQTTDVEAARRRVPLVVVAHDDIVFVSCKPRRPDLEAVFLELTGGESGDAR